MLSIPKIARASEWWEYKLPPMLAIAYATGLRADRDLSQLAPHLCILLLGIIIGATYVSILNDLTDIKEDKASGKYNRLMNVQPLYRWVLVAVPVVAGFFFTCIFLTDALTIGLYIACWICFSLYSVPPFRFKKRGFLGVIADAGGAHLFPTLFLLSATAHYFQIRIDWLWFGIVSVWSLMYGLRGILWHQFYDRNNDLKAGVSTYASRIDPSLFYKQSMTVMGIELIALAFILNFIFKPLPIIALFLYFLMLIGYRKISKLMLIAIVPPQSRPWHFAMNNYYQLLLPISLLCTSATMHPLVWIIVAAHFILFPLITRNTFMDIIYFSRVTIKKLMY